MTAFLIIGTLVAGAAIIYLVVALFTFVVGVVDRWRR